MMYQKRTPANDHSTRSTNQRRLCRNHFTTRAPRIPINHLLSTYFQIDIKVPFFLELQKWNYSWFFISLRQSEVAQTCRWWYAPVATAYSRNLRSPHWQKQMVWKHVCNLSFFGIFQVFFLLRNSSGVLIGESESD